MALRSRCSPAPRTRRRPMPWVMNILLPFNTQPSIRRAPRACAVRPSRSRSPVRSAPTRPAIRRSPAWASNAFHRLAREARDVRRAEPVVRSDGQPERAVGARDLLDDDRVRERVERGTAVLLRNVDTEKSQLAERGNDLAGKRSSSSHDLRGRRDVVARKTAGGVADREVGRVELNVMDSESYQVGSEPDRSGGKFRYASHPPERETSLALTMALQTARSSARSGMLP